MNNRKQIVVLLIALAATFTTCKREHENKKDLEMLALAGLLHATAEVSGAPNGNELPKQFGTGADGDIVVYNGTVNIRELYENDVVSGVITHRGKDKGLNHKGADANDDYDPQKGRYVNASSFTIKSSATLTSDAWGNASDNRKGIVWIALTGSFVNEGTIDMNGKGALGGLGGAIENDNGAGGYGNGGGGGGIAFWQGRGFGGAGGGGGNAYLGADGRSDLYGATGGLAGRYYGNREIPLDWPMLYGSGGGGAAFAYPSGGGYGGTGGGAIRIYGNEVINVGIIGVNGNNGASGSVSSYGSGGGGGSGGTVYIEAIVKAELGTNIITARGGGYGAGDRGIHGGAGSVGRIHIVGEFTGETNSPPVE